MRKIYVPSARRDTTRKLPPLENGDHLDQKTFHERYEAMPEDVKAELIGGIVYMASPQKIPHGRSQGLITRWLDEYEEATPGVAVLLGSTAILGPESEPQPDACLIILPECGGQTWEDAKEYLNGAPELVVEVASATESIDLNAKKRDYETSGAREYLVVALRTKRVFWFVRRRRKFKDLASDQDGILRSETFPGLWLDPEALLRNDRQRLLAVLREGIGSPAHAAFVTKLANR